jgi:hypothetical protein
MEKLDSQVAIDNLCGQFAGFLDAVLVEIALHLPRQSRDRHAEFQLLARDSDGNWCRVKFVVSSLRAYKLEEGRVSHLVLSNGLRIVHHYESTFVDLAPYSDQADEDTLLLSHQYVVGGECRYEIEVVLM